MELIFILSTLSPLILISLSVNHFGRLKKTSYLRIGLISGFVYASLISLFTFVVGSMIFMIVDISPGLILTETIFVFIPEDIRHLLAVFVTFVSLGSVVGGLVSIIKRALEENVKYVLSVVFYSSFIQIYLFKLYDSLFFKNAFTRMEFSAPSEWAWISVVAVVFPLLIIANMLAGYLYLLVVKKLNTLKIISLIGINIITSIAMIDAILTYWYSIWKR